MIHQTETRVKIVSDDELDHNFFRTGAEGVIISVVGDAYLIRFDKGDYNKESEGEWYVYEEDVTAI